MKEQIEGPPQWWRVAWHRLMVALFSRRWSRKPTPPVRLRRLVRLAVGWERLLFGFCPECNSDAPAKYSCRICTPCAYPPSEFTKHLWWTRFKQANAGALASERSEDSQQRIVGTERGEK